MKACFECAASTVIEGRADAWKNERGVHIRAFGVSWILTPEEARRLARDIRKARDDDEPWDPRFSDAHYLVDYDEYTTVSIRYKAEDTVLAIDHVDAEMLADWLEGCE